MNNRDYKQFTQGSVHHIYNRGVGKMNIFLDEEDYSFFLKRLREALYPSQPRPMKPMMPIAHITQRENRRSHLPDGAFDLLLYCLMPNHFHLVVQQNSELPISVLVSKICTSYSKYFNKRYDRVGSLYQDQFKAALVKSNEQLLWLAAYIHNNPSKAKLVKDLNKYPYSSHLDYLGVRKGTLCKKELVLAQYKSVEDYKKSVMKFDEKLLFDGLKID